MITTATRPRTRKSDISRAVGAVLGRDNRNAAHGWDVYDDGVRIVITLNYMLRDTDRRAFEDLKASPLGKRYRLYYTPALLGDEYEHMPAAYEGCGVVDLIRREEPTPTPAAQEPTATPQTTPTTVTVTLPAPFANALEASPLIEDGRADNDDDRALIDAYTPGGTITTDSLPALRALLDHAEMCQERNDDDRDRDDHARAEYDAARTAADRTRTAITALKTAQEAQEAPTAPQESQQADQGAPVPVEIVWMHREGDRITGMIQLGNLTPADRATVEATGREDQAHITSSRRRATLDAFSDYDPADGFNITGKPDAVARHFADWLGFTGRPVALKTIDETRM